MALKVFAGGAVTALISEVLMGKEFWTPKAITEKHNKVPEHSG